MEVVKAVVMVPREMRTPPSITTGWKPKRLDSTDARGAVDELKGVGFAYYLQQRGQKGSVTH
jgi:hypothetical protein